MVRYGSARTLIQHKAQRGMAWLGEARLGQVWRGKARRGKAGSLTNKQQTTAAQHKVRWRLAPAANDSPVVFLRQRTGENDDD